MKLYTYIILLAHVLLAAGGTLPAVHRRDGIPPPAALPVPEDTVQPPDSVAQGMIVRGVVSELGS
jgi:hypothetical protein